MDKEEMINKAFEGRWRIKSQYLAESLEKMLIEYRIDHVKRLCRDFFEAGIMLTTEPLVATYNDVCDISCPFEKFWDLYDKKVGRPKCEKLWHKLSMKERVDCLNYIPLYKQAQPEKCYRKNPETFLRNKSFYDEIIIRHNPDQQRQQRLAAAAERIAEYTKDGK